MPSEDIFRITAGVRACVCTAIYCRIRQTNGKHSTAMFG